MNSSSKSLALVWSVALLLAGCETQTTHDQSQAEARRTPSATPATKALVAVDSTTKTLPDLAGPARVINLQLPSAPDFEVPQVELPNAAAARCINQTLTRLLLTANLNDTTAAPTAAQAVRRAVAAYEANNQIGMTSAGFEVLFNQRGLLSLALTNEYMGAYPSTATSHVTFDVHTGRRVALPELLADTLALRQQWHRRISKRVATYLQTMVHKSPSDSDDQATVRQHTSWNDATHQVDAAALPALRDFALTAKGLVLYTSFEFPHAVLALAPADSYLFSYASINRWLIPQSPFQSVH